MNQVLGLFLISTMFSFNAYGYAEFVVKTDERGRPYVREVTAAVDPQTNQIIVTANLMNSDKQENETDEIIYGGRFSPTVATYLKPISTSKIRAFIQVRCETYDCSSLWVAIGFRNKTNNPYAYNEQRFILAGN